LGPLFVLESSLMSLAIKVLTIDNDLEWTIL